MYVKKITLALSLIIMSCAVFEVEICHAQNCRVIENLLNDALDQREMFLQELSDVESELAYIFDERIRLVQSLGGSPPKKWPPHLDHHREAELEARILALESAIQDVDMNIALFDWMLSMCQGVP